MEYEQIIYEKVSPHIVYITLNRPEKMNSVTHEMFQSWGKAITEAERDDDVKVIVFRGAGKCFSAGAPLDQVGYVYGMTDPKHGERGRQNSAPGEIRISTEACSLNFSVRYYSARN